MSAQSWSYMLDGMCIARISRPNTDKPYVGMPVDMVGRLGVPAPVEQFVVAAIRPDSRMLILKEASQ